MKKQNSFKKRIPALIFIIFVALAVFATKNHILNIVFIGIGLAGFFIARNILNKK